MSETLSYQEPESTELNTEEQDSLQIGEQMEQEQQQLLAGKYKSSEELEKAYLELQSKLGQSNESEEAPEPQQTEEEPESKTEEPTESEEPQLTQEDVDYLQDMAGGKNGYESMLKWAASSLEQKEIDMYDAVMEQGNPSAVYFAVQALVSRYNDATGTDGKLLTGKGSTESGTTYRSQQELVAAMSDPRYDNDPAYRQDVINRLERSDLQF